MKKFIAYDNIQRNFSLYICEDADDAALAWAVRHIPEQVKCRRIPFYIGDHQDQNWLEIRIDKGRIRAGFKPCGCEVCVAMQEKRGE